MQSAFAITLDSCLITFVEIVIRDRTTRQDQVHMLYRDRILYQLHMLSETGFCIKSICWTGSPFLNHVPPLLTTSSIHKPYVIREGKHRGRL